MGGEQIADHVVRPVVVLVDNSASMIAGGKIETVNCLLKSIISRLAEWHSPSRSSELCIVSCGERVTVIQEFSSLEGLQPPILKASGASLLGAGILKTLALLLARGHYYGKQAIRTVQPEVVFLCGSEPEDLLFSSMSGEDEWHEVRATIASDRSLGRYRISPVAILAMEGANAAGLSDVVVWRESDLHREGIQESGDTCTSNSVAAVGISSDVLIHRGGKDADLEVVRRRISCAETDHSCIRFLNSLFPEKHYSRVVYGNGDNVEWPFAVRSEDIEKEGTVCLAMARTGKSVEDRSLEEVKEDRQNRNPNILGESVIGPLHIIKGIPCQDAYTYKALTPGCTIVAIADGLGSAAMSEIGSRVAVTSAVRAISKRCPEELFNSDLGSLAKVSVVAAREALEKRAAALRCDLRDLACTFISVAIREQSVAVAHIGDGAVIGKRGDDLVVLSDAGDSEYANEVTPLTSNRWEESLHVSPTFSGIAGIMGFSDGLQRAALRKGEGSRIAYPAFCAPLFSFAEQSHDQLASQVELRQFLTSKKMSDHSEDDKTLVFVTGLSEARAV